MSRSIFSSTDFNPRSPCGERQSPDLPGCGEKDFNPRSPCGERLAADRKSTTTVEISIHAPRVGSDLPLLRGESRPRYFNPRSPCGERLSRSTLSSLRYMISIHAPRVGSDKRRRWSRLWLSISIHAPRVGSDRCRFRWFSPLTAFQSTLPVWGATNCQFAAGSKV